MLQKERLLALHFNDLVREVGKKAGVKQETTKKVIRHTFNVIGTKMVEGILVRIPRFGLFHIKMRKGRITSMPGSNCKIMIRDRYYPKCAFSSAIKQNLRIRYEGIEMQENREIDGENFQRIDENF